MPLYLPHAFREPFACPLTKPLPPALTPSKEMSVTEYLAILKNALSEYIAEAERVAQSFGCGFETVKSVNADAHQFIVTHGTWSHVCYVTGRELRQNEKCPASLARFKTECACEAVLEAAKAIPPAPQADAGGWVSWNGGDCPFKAAHMQLKLRNEDIHETHAPETWRWTNRDTHADIIAYRVIADK